MQVLENQESEVDKQQIILDAIGDKYCRKILSAIQEKPKSAMEIAQETKIPITTVYRRLQTLHDGNLTHISGIISDDGRKNFLYKSKFAKISANCDFATNRIDVALN